MNPQVFIYCEGNEAKIVVVQMNKSGLKILRASNLEIITSSFDSNPEINGLTIENVEDNFSIDGIETESNENSLKVNSFSTISVMDSIFDGIKLKKCQFIPVLTEPSIYYHTIEGSQRNTTSKVTQEIANELQQQRNINIDIDNIAYVPLADKSYLSVFVSGEIGCIKLINSLADYNGRRYYKINSVKSAEISLVYYVAKKKKFFPDDSSLVVYIGKEYSKLIFLKGRKIKHIGSTLDIGKKNLHTYDVYFSKILLEMENGGISSLDNIIVCGEDDSENLLLSFYGTFPEADVSKLDFKGIDQSELTSAVKKTISSFSVPLAAAVDYFAELKEEHKGINLIPKYVKEQQKLLQFGWHGFLIFPLLFLATFYFTQKILSNSVEIKKLDKSIVKYQRLHDKNQAILNQITNFETKINNFGRTQSILDSVSVGTLVWTKAINNISSFIRKHKNIWLTKLFLDADGTVKIEGFSLNKFVVTDLADNLRSSELKGVFYETLREKKSYKFTISFELSSYNKAGK